MNAKFSVPSKPIPCFYALQDLKRCIESPKPEYCAYVIHVYLQCRDEEKENPDRPYRRRVPIHHGWK